MLFFKQSWSISPYVATIGAIPGYLYQANKENFYNNQHSIRLKHLQILISMEQKKYENLLE